MNRRGWNSKTLKSTQLRKFLLYEAGLEKNYNYKKVKRLSDMSQASIEIGIDGSFQSKRDKNYILFYSNNKNSEFNQIFYYIRCAIAHGRFQIYNSENIRYYVFEAVTKERGEDKYIVKARMVLKEETLLNWINMIEGGPNKLNMCWKNRRYSNLKKDILDIIKNNPHISRNNIIKKLQFPREEMKKYFDRLKTNGEIAYNREKKEWELIDETEE